MLTLKQKMFAQEYLRDGNGARAALAAGYAEKSARNMAHTNLKNPEIQEYLSATSAHVMEATTEAQEAKTKAALAMREAKTEAERARRAALSRKARRDEDTQDAALELIAPEVIKPEEQGMVISALRVLEVITALSTTTLDHFICDEMGFVTLSEDAPPDAMQAVKSITRTIRNYPDGTTVVNAKIALWDKPKSLDMLAKHLALYAPVKAELTGPNGGPIETIDAKAELMAMIARIADRQKTGDEAKRLEAAEVEQ